MWENAGGFAGALHRADDVQEVSVVTLLLRWHTPREALEAILRGCEASRPGLIGEGRIGHDIVVGTEPLTLWLLLAISYLFALEQISLSMRWPYVIDTRSVQIAIGSSLPL